VEHDLDGPEFGDTADIDLDGAGLDGPEVESHAELVVPGHQSVGAAPVESSAVEDGAHEGLHQESAELDIDGSLLDTIEEELADVERALALLDEGGYGRCEACGGTIDDEVLTLTPTARFCAEHLPLTLR
jgi:RNA polymerase-binding transcription factor DksA